MISELISKLEQKTDLTYDQVNNVMTDMLSGKTNDKDNADSLKLAQDVVSQILAAVLNFSDLNDNFCLACDEAGMVKILIKLSKELQDSVSHHVKYMVGKQYYYTKSCFSTSS